MSENEKISIFKDAIAETIWPTRCAICDKPGYLLCPSCSRKLPYIDQSKTCPICGEPFGSIQCCGCKGQTSFDKCISAFFLNQDTGKLITTYKDSGERRLSKVIAYFLSKIIDPYWLSPSSFLTYIPSTNEAVLRRGFDHAKLTAEELASLLNIKLVCAFAPPSNEDQRKLGRNQRILNISNKFSVTKDLRTALISGYKHAVLIDDVFTTGATLFSASQVLKEAGATSVFCANFSRTF